jgi:hypothetical protein
MKSFEEFMKEDWKPGEHFKQGEHYGTVTKVGKRDVHFKHESGHDDKFNANHEANSRYSRKEKIDVTPAEHKSNLESAHKEVAEKGLQPVRKWGGHESTYHDGHKVVAKIHHGTGKLEPHGSHEMDHEAHTAVKKTSTSEEARGLQKKHDEAAEMHKKLSYSSDHKPVEEHHKELAKGHEAKAKEYGNHAVDHYKRENESKGVHHLDHAVTSGHGGSTWSSQQEEHAKAHHEAADFHKAEAKKAWSGPNPDKAKADHHEDMANKHTDRAHAHEAFHHANHLLEHAKKHLENHLKKDYWSRD